MKVLLTLFLSCAFLVAQGDRAELDAVGRRIVELYRAERYAEAIEAASKAVTLAEKIYPPYHPDIADWLKVLGSIYRSQGRYYDAEPIFSRVLEIDEHVFGPDHSNTAESLNDLADLYDKQGQYDKA